MTALGKLFRTTAFKLSIAFLAIFALGSGLVLARIGSSVKTLLDEQMAQTIEAEINGLSEQYAQGGVRRLIQVVDRRVREPGASLYLVTTFAGEKLAGNIEALPAGSLARPGIIETDYQRVGEGAEQVHKALARVILIPNGGFRLLVGRDLEERERLRKVMARSLFTSLAYIAAFGVIGGLFVAFRVLRRVDGMNATAQTIMSGDMTGRLPISGTGDEFDRLAQNLNAMIERIGELMNGLREVSDNIAHDLKTPLTRLRNRAEEALRSAKAEPDYRAALERMIEESDQLIRIFNALLMIARAEAGAQRESMTDVDAALIAAGVAELYEPLAEEAGAPLTVDAAPPLPIHANRELVSQAVANLIDNALKYGADGDKAGGVAVSARRVGNDVEIAVADRGPGIAAGDRGRVLDRFVRLEGSRSRPGSGLGLSLASAVARLHGGQLRLEDNEPGLRVVLSFPSPPSPAVAP